MIFISCFGFGCVLRYSTIAKVSSSEIKAPCIRIGSLFPGGKNRESPLPNNFSAPFTSRITRESILETEPNMLNNVLSAFDNLDINILESKIEMVASNEIELENEARAKVEALIEKLEDNDDIQNIYTNLK